MGGVTVSRIYGGIIELFGDWISIEWKCDFSVAGFSLLRTAANQPPERFPISSMISTDGLIEKTGSFCTVWL